MSNNSGIQNAAALMICVDPVTAEKIGPRRGADAVDGDGGGL